MKNTQENIEKMGREGTIIKYSKDEIENKDTNIIFYIFEDENISKNVAIFVLNYTHKNEEKQEPYQVVLGKIELKKNDGQLVEKAKIIRDYLLTQLRVNNKGKNNYEICKQLDAICVKKEIPFIYTDEGIQIITASESGENILERTYTFEEENNIMKVKCLNPSRKMNLYMSEANIRQKINERIKRNKMDTAAMMELKNNKDKEKFLMGKKIEDLRKETSEEVIFYRKNIVIAYLVKQYEKTKGKKDDTENKHKLNLEDYIKLKKYLKDHNIDREIDPSTIIANGEEESDLEKYFRLKEKSLAIDVRKILEDAQNEYIEQESNNNQTNIGENNKYLYINNCKTIFDFVKQGKDFNTQFCYKQTIGENFEQLYSIVRKQGTKKDRNGEPIYNLEEILSYLHLKEEILKGIKLGKKKSFLEYDIYSENESVKKFVDFVINVDSRKDTKKEEKRLITEFYKDMISEVICKNKESISLYNEYAKRFNLEPCPIKDKSSEKNEEER